jgi:hypothetical protein
MPRDIFDGSDKLGIPPVPGLSPENFARRTSAWSPAEAVTAFVPVEVPDLLVTRECEVGDVLRIEVSMPLVDFAAVSGTATNNVAAASAVSDKGWTGNFGWSRPFAAGPNQGRPLYVPDYHVCTVAGLHTFKVHLTLFFATIPTVPAGSFLAVT